MGGKQISDVSVSATHMSNIVTSIVEDQRGTLWCGTADGLFQLTGNEFKPFNPSEY